MADKLFIFNRHQWTIVSVALAFISVIAYVTAVYEDATYTTCLIWWFLTCLGLFHALFFRWESITQTQVRMIDYPYLLAAALSIMLAVVQGEKDRSQMIVSLTTPFAPTTVTELQLLLQRTVPEFCGKGDGWVDYPGFCPWVSDLKSFIDKPHTNEEIATKFAQAEGVAKSNGWVRNWAMMPYDHALRIPTNYMRASLRALFAFKNPFSSAVTFSVVISEFASIQADLILQSLIRIPNKTMNRSPIPSSPDDLRSIFRVVFWPFLAAIALALRLTKVTADVSDWAKRT